MTRYAIGDIHGGAKTFRALLGQLELTKQNRVYLLGDYIDRGPDSKGVLDYILHLQESGYDIRPLRGNHEDMLIRAFEETNDHFAINYMKAYGAKLLRNFEISSITDLPDRYKQFLKDLPYILEDGRFIFVHACLDMSREFPITETPEETMLWGNGGFFSDNDIEGRTIISGHTIRSVEKITASLTKSHIQIDNGAFCNYPPDNGNLVALNLDEMKLIFQPWLDGHGARDLLMQPWKSF